jgi:hypothetical protein
VSQPFSAVRRLGSGSDQHNYDVRGFGRGLHGLADGVAVDLGQANVKQDQIGAILLDKRQHLRAVTCFGHADTGALEGSPK